MMIEGEKALRQLAFKEHHNVRTVTPKEMAKIITEGDAKVFEMVQVQVNIGQNIIEPSIYFRFNPIRVRNNRDNTNVEIELCNDRHAIKFVFTNKNTILCFNTTKQDDCRCVVFEIAYKGDPTVLITMAWFDPDRIGFAVEDDE